MQLSRRCLKLSQKLKKYLEGKITFPSSSTLKSLLAQRSILIGKWMPNYNSRPPPPFCTSAQGPITMFQLFLFENLSMGKHQRLVAALVLDDRLDCIGKTDFLDHHKGLLSKTSTATWNWLHPNLLEVTSRSLNMLIYLSKPKIERLKY